MNTLGLQSIVFIFGFARKMLITDEENKERDHPLFMGQSIWSSITLEIANCPYFLVCSEIRDQGEWFRQTFIVYELRNLIDRARRIKASKDERMFQVALITPYADPDRGWSMHNVQEVWLEKTDDLECREVYLTTDQREIHYSDCSQSLSSPGKVKVFSLPRHS